MKRTDSDLKKEGYEVKIDNGVLSALYQFIAASGSNHI